MRGCWEERSVNLSWKWTEDGRYKSLEDFQQWKEGDIINAYPDKVKGHRVL